MRHQKSGRKLNRTSSHREAMFKNMASSLIKHELIRTTLPKAKELRRVAEPLITLAKVDSAAKRRLAYSRLRDVAVVEKLFDDLGPRFKARAGGYTRILKMEPRPGDSADMALMQLVEGLARLRVDQVTTGHETLPWALVRSCGSAAAASRGLQRMHSAFYVVSTLTSMVVSACLPGKAEQEGTSPGKTRDRRDDDVRGNRYFRREPSCTRDRQRRT